MSSFEKLVKLACKPKAAAPKSKYIDPLISATYADDGSIHDICRALAPRFKEPNAVIVFKALIVLHSMIRQGQTDNVLKYLASSDVLRLRNVTNGQWDGYIAPQNIANYAMYLDCRVRTYKDLKHDAIRVQSESNRDRLSTADDEGSSSGKPVKRSKTIMGRKLRVMTVEKGLLRETKMVQRLTDALLECKLHEDSLEDELNVTALRMLVKDLLILFQATNEGVINVLEHYFEMSHVDAENALKIYQHFCKQTERVVNYLGIAKKLQNVLNVQIPNLRHAPVSLAKTLEEYLKDPNFEDNRLEYRNSKLIADGGSVGKQSGKAPEAKSNPTVKIPENNAASSSAAQESAKPGKSELMDFFASIEQEQPSMFDPQSQSPTNNYFQQQSQFNPFLQRQQMMPAQMTGMPNMNGQQPFIQPQVTGFATSSNNPFPQQSQQPFLVPQATAVPFQPQAQPLQPQATAVPFLQPQATAVPFLQPQDTARPFQPQQQSFVQSAPFLQPQMTGSNPFRQTMILPQTTGLPFPSSAPPNPFPSNPFPSNPFPSNPFPSNPASPAAQPAPTGVGANGIIRPASTPIGGTERRTNSIGQTIAPLVAQATGSRNPFGPVAPPPPPPVPKLPTLGELASGTFSGFSGNNAFSSANATGDNGPAGQTQGGGLGTFGQTNGSIQPQQTGAPAKNIFDMSSIASSFAFGDSSSKDTPTAAGQLKPLDPQATATSSAFSSDRASIFSAQPTGSSFTSTTPSLLPQLTGFSGSAVKPFKPSSSFGAELMDNLPNTSSNVSSGSTSPFGASKTGAGDATAPSLSFGSTLGTQPTGSVFGGLSSQPTGLGSTFGSTLGAGSSLGVGLRPQITGLGGANPFRASMFNTLGSGSATSSSLSSGLGEGNNLGSGIGAGNTLAGSASMGSSLGSGFGGNNPFPSSAAGASNSTSPFGAQLGTTPGLGGTSPFGSGSAPQQQQQQPSFSLI